MLTWRPLFHMLLVDLAENVDPRGSGKAVFLGFPGQNNFPGEVPFSCTLRDPCRSHFGIRAVTWSDIEDDPHLFSGLENHGMGFPFEPDC